jgi:polygalacturonase
MRCPRLLCVPAIAACCVCAQDTRRVAEPVVPASCAALPARFSAAPGPGVAEGDEDKPDTLRIQQALDGCPPGKAVELRADGAHNAFLSGPLQLRGGVTLLVNGGVTLFASRNPRDYDVSPGSCGVVDHNGHGCRPLIGGNGVSGAAVMGPGVIDGRGGASLAGTNVSWWDLAQQAKRDNASQNCPRILVLSHAKDFTLYRITLRNSPNFHVSFNGDGFTAWGVIVDSPKTARNTDGIDPSSATNVTITHCFIHAGDDNVAIKAGSTGPSSHMTIAHNHFYTGHGMSIGSETDGGVEGIRVTDLTIDGADNGIRIKSNASRGGLVHDVTYSDICIRDTKNPVVMDSTYPFYGDARDKLPEFQGLLLHDVRVLGPGKITLQGYDAQHHLGMAFDNVHLDDAAGTSITASHAVVTLGPGPVNFRPSGDDVTVNEIRGSGEPIACEARFVPFPKTAP